MSINTRLLGAAGAIALAAGPMARCASAQPLDSVVVRTDLGARIDRYLSTLAVYGMSGSIFVARNGDVILHKAYGLADRERHIPLRVDMPMLIGSLSKQFVAAAILRLEEMGRLSVGDSLPRFFDAVPADKRAITIHQLLTHTSGLAYLPEGDFFAPMPRDEVMRTTLASPLIAAPGAGYSYSNPGYTLLAGIVEKCTGSRYEDFIRREIFARAGMASSGFESDSGSWRERLVVHSYTGSGDEGPASAFPVAPRLTGAGSVVTTVSDLYRWELALESSRVLADSSRRKLLTPYVDEGGPARAAYGWNVVTTPRNTTLITHAGDIGGYNADFRHYIDEGLVVIFLSNARAQAGGYRQAVMNNVSLLVAGARYAAPPAIIALDSQRLEGFVGRYRMPSGEVASVWRDRGHVMIGAERREGIGLLSGGDDDTTAARFDERALAIARDVSRADFASLRDALSPSLPFDGVRDELSRELALYTDSLGALRDVEVLGTAVLSTASARSYIRLGFARGSIVQEWSWTGAVIGGFDAGMRAAMPTQLEPVTPTEAASFDPFSGRSVGVELVDGGRALRITSGSRTVEAVRIG
jgi:CubicO group peptidase (beta-lactamase class C family)